MTPHRIELWLIADKRTPFANHNGEHFQVLTKQLQALKPEHKNKIPGPRNPPLWVLNPTLYTDPATWSRPPKYDVKLPPRVFPISIINDLVVRHYRATHSAPLGIRGRYWPLLYVLLATLIAPPNNKCVLVVDCDGGFQVGKILECTPVSMLPLLPHMQPGNLPGDLRDRARPPYHRGVLAADLAHVYVVRPADSREGPLCRAILSAKQYMMYGQHRSRDREFWGTVVIGADDPGADVDVVCGTMRCWLKVERQYVPGLGGRGVTSYEGALKKRAEHEAERAFTPLAARCIWGRFNFDERGLVFPSRPRQAEMQVGGSRVRARRRSPPRLQPVPWVITLSAYHATRVMPRSEGSEVR